MHTGLRLGRVAGVDIGINWSWLIVVALITWSLASAVFPTTNEGLGTGTYVAMALAATILYFASLLLHELAHAVQARREGMQVSGITLWVFGGVARFSGRFPSAGAEFRVAFAGPLVTLLLGIAFVGGATLLRLPAEVDAVLSWLGLMNLFLFAFKMLPAVPLDGGRVLHSRAVEAARVALVGHAGGGRPGSGVRAAHDRRGRAPGAPRGLCERALAGADRLVRGRCGSRRDRDERGAAGAQRAVRLLCPSTGR